MQEDSSREIKCFIRRVMERTMVTIMNLNSIPGLWRPAPVLQELDITILNGTWCYQKLDGLYEDEINICYEASLAGSCKVSKIQLLGH